MGSRGVVGKLNAIDARRGLGPTLAGPHARSWVQESIVIEQAGYLLRPLGAKFNNGQVAQADCQTSIGAVEQWAGVVRWGNMTDNTVNETNDQII